MSNQGLESLKEERIFFECGIYLTWQKIFGVLDCKFSLFLVFSSITVPEVKSTPVSRKR